MRLENKLLRAFSRLSAALALVAGVAILPTESYAHSSEQAFVLLLPTDVYISAGVAVVVATVLFLAFLPKYAGPLVFKSRPVGSSATPRLEAALSLLSLGFLTALIVIGFKGPRDPLTNPLPLFIWTVWWIGFVSIQGLVGDVWRFVNPWTGLYQVARGVFRKPAPLTLSPGVGCFPAIAALFAFAALLLADIAPEDPARLAKFTLGYVIYTFTGMFLFGGREWLERAECFSLLLHQYAKLSPFSHGGSGAKIGLPGWQLIQAPAPSFSVGCFILMILAIGSFDGFNETFWWLDLIGINPLEFPGRSAVFWQTIFGLLAANIVLCLVFAAAVRGGLNLVGEGDRFAYAFGRLAGAILPIAFAYHVSHFLISLLVNGQYAIKAVNDPLDTGADLLGLGHMHVTTGFLNSHGSVEVLWLTQAGFVVVGHILSLFVSHSIAVDMFGDAKTAARSQIPLALFMIAYTLFGLALLAAPKGA